MVSDQLGGASPAGPESFLPPPRKDPITTSSSAASGVGPPPWVYEGHRADYITSIFVIGAGPQSMSFVLRMITRYE